MMENGELLAADVLPKVAKEMKKVAAVGLEDKLDTLRVAQGQFFNELQKAGDTIFKGGFAEGLKGLFFTLGEFLKENEHALKSLGKVFGLVFNIVTIIAKAFLPVISVITSAIGVLSEALNTVFGDETYQNVLANAVAVGAVTAAVMGLVSANKVLNTVLKGQLATRLALLAANPAAWPFLAAAGVGLGVAALGKGSAALSKAIYDPNNTSKAPKPNTSYVSGDYTRFPEALKPNFAKAIELSIKTEDGLEGRIVSTVESMNSNARVEVV